jgi:hypothetical protein
MPVETFESFMRRYGRPDGAYPVIEVAGTIEHWPIVVIKFGDKTAVIQFCGVGADNEHPHLSIDIHAFADKLARAGVFGMENGKRHTTFDDTTPGTSHGWPAVLGITVLIGQQATRERDS